MEIEMQHVYDIVFIILLTISLITHFFNNTAYQKSADARISVLRREKKKKEEEDNVEEYNSTRYIRRNKKKEEEEEEDDDEDTLIKKYKDSVVFSKRYFVGLTIFVVIAFITILGLIMSEGDHSTIEVLLFAGITLTTLGDITYRLGGRYSEKDVFCYAFYDCGLSVSPHKAVQITNGIVTVVEIIIVVIVTTLAAIFGSRYG